MECKFLMKCLHKALKRGDPSSAREALIGVSTVLDDSVSSHVIDLAILNIFAPGDKINYISILDFIEDVFINGKFSEAVCEGFKILEKLLSSNYKIKLELHLNKIVEICLKILRSACIARIKEICLSSLIAVASGPWPDVVQDIVDLLMIHINRKSEKPTVMSKEYELIGLICRNHPEQIDAHSEDIGKSILQVIEECVEGKAKISFPLLEGCFKGMSDYLFNFEQPYELIYKGIRLFSDSKEQKKHGYARAALNIIIQHGNHFMEWLKNDRKYWHPLLLKCVNQSNRDDKKIGCKAILKFYEHVGNSLSNSNQNEETSSCLQFFMSYFKTILCDKNMNAEISYSVSTYEINIALKGFAIFLSSCKTHIKDEEFKEIAETITQRALLLYKEDKSNTYELSETADEESTERIEELCNHIEALAAMKYNSDSNLEMLVYALISGFPKCLHHRHYIVKNAVKKVLPLINTQIVVSYLLNESCRHFVSSSLYWNKGSVFSKNSLLTYEVFMPLWEFIFEVDEDNYEFSKYAFDELLKNVLKLLPTLNLSIKSVDNQKEIENMDENSEFSHLEPFEIPEHPNDYKLFINICDLLSAILSLKQTYEWLNNWIQPLLSLILNGRQKFYNAMGFLTILETVLKCLKKLEKENITSVVISQELTDIGKIVIELLSEISITNNDKLFELRLALVLLQTPSQLLTTELLENATHAFKLVFLLGRTNLNLAFEALAVLEDWDIHLSRDAIRPVYNELLPIFNEYLCSTGIIESNEKNKNMQINSRSKVTKKNVKKETNSQLNMFQHHIMMFLGKIDSLPIQSYLISLKKESGNFNEEIKDLQFGQEKIKLSLPYFQQHNLLIHLDGLIPRIKYLALHSSNRDTRITACQTMHSIIVVAYGTGVSLPISQKTSFSHVQLELFSILLCLASDSDESISRMFAPLLKQTCHWLSIGSDNMTIECNNFLSVLFKGCSHPNNSLIQDVSCEAVKEFIAWHIKKSSHHTLKSLSSCISYILRTLCQMMLHPHYNQKYGAYLVIIRIIPQLYSINSAIDKYFPELLYSIVKSIKLVKSSKNLSIIDHISSNDSIEIKVLDKILIVIERKGSILSEVNPVRRRPPEFGDGTIDDIALWLLSQLKCDHRPLANRCFSAFLIICGILKSEDRIPKTFVQNLIKKDGIDAVILKYFQVDEVLFNKNEIDFKKLYESVNQFYLIFDIHLNVLISGIFSIDEFYSESFHFKSMVLQFDSFLQFLSESNLNIVFGNLMKNNMEIAKDNKSNKILKHLFENMIFQTIWKFFDLLFFLSSKSIFDTDILSKSISRALVSIIFETHKFEIFRRNINDDEVKRFFNSLKSNTLFIWPVFVNVIHKRILQLFQQLNVNSCLKPEISFDYLNILSGIITSFDMEKQKSLAQHLGNINISDLFNLLFTEQNNSVLLAKTSIEISLLRKSIVNLLNFIFKLNLYDIKTFINVLIDNRIISNSDSEFSSKRIDIKYGEFCLSIFKNEIINEIVENSENFFVISFDVFSHENRFRCISLIDQILQYSSEKNVINEKFYSNLFLYLAKIWPLLMEWNFEFSTLLHTYSLLAMASPDPLNTFGSSENPLNSWLLSNLKNPNTSLKNKIKLTMLLPTILSPDLTEKWYTLSTREALDELHNNFPQSCYEFEPHSKSRALYLSAIKTLLETLANSGSSLVLECVIKSTAGDRKHVCEEQISHKLKSFFRRLNSKEQLYVLNEVQKIINGCSNPNLLFNIVNRFMIPLLLSANSDILETFFSKCITFMMKSVVKRITNNMSQYLLEHLFVEWICACKILETMFIKVPFVVLDSPQSEISKTLKFERQGQFVKDIFAKIFQIHKTNSSDFLQDNAREFLRLSHCAAYKCLYSITIARPQEEMKLYIFLINPKGSNWESMIDFNKKYEFPLVTDKMEKNKAHLIPTKRNNPHISHIISSTLFLQNTYNYLTVGSASSIKESQTISRNTFLKQTLSENILSFDMNHAIIRDSSDSTLKNEPDSDIVNYSMDLADDDLNNHESMAIVCQLVKDLDRIFLAESTYIEPGFGNYSAPWVQYIVDVIGDSSRHNNVRLFLVQMIDNLRDIFKKYSNMLLNSILSVIVDRCTSYNKKINHLDICLISMLLSWSDNTLPKHATEINKASVLYRFIVEEIDPSFQSSDIFRKCIELSKDIISCWGQLLILPYDSILKKINFESDSKKCGLQIIASILINKIAVWSTSDDFEVFTKAILECLKLNDRTLYRASAEIIGLSLDILSNSNSKIQEFCQSDLNLKEDCSESSLNFIIQINKILSKWFETEYEKFIESLYGIHKHFSFCNESLLSKVLLLLLRFPTEQKKMCLKILLDSMNVLDKKMLYKELKALDFDNLLSNYDIRILALHILNKAFNYLSVEEIASLINDIHMLCSVSKDKESQCRAISYDILMKIYTELCEQVEDISDIFQEIDNSIEESTNVSRKRSFSNLKINSNWHFDKKYAIFISQSSRREIKLILLQGLNDEDKEIRTRAHLFWTKHFSSKSHMHERWISILHEFLGDNVSNNTSCLGNLVQIVIASCQQADNFVNMKIFNNPLEECTFMDYEWKDNKQMRKLNINPKFVETLNSQMLSTTLLQQKQHENIYSENVFKSMNTLVNSNPKLFMDEGLFGQNSLSMSSINLLNKDVRSLEREQNKELSDSFSLSTETSLLFTLQPQLIHRQTYKKIKQDTKQTQNSIENVFEKRLRKKFITNKNQQAIKFSGIATRKNIENKQKMNAEKPIMAFKSFRDGDYPDIQINFQDILVPLFQLALRDEIVSKNLFIIVFQSIKNHLIENSNQISENPSISSDRNFLSKFELMSLYSILKTLKGITSVGLPSQFISALLQICRNCLNSSHVFNEFDQIINNVSKICDIRWLGTLILEEKKIFEEPADYDQHNKKVKLSAINDEEIELSDEIYKLKNSNQWNLLLALYDKVTDRENLSDDLYNNYVEEYFKCFTHLSDWEGLIEKVSYQYSDDSTSKSSTSTFIFNYNTLWKGPWTKNFILPLIFDANIHRLSLVNPVQDFPKLPKDERKSLAEHLQNFKDYIDNWNCDAEKTKYLKSNLSSKYAIWKAMLNFDVDTLEIIKDSLLYLRDCWIQEYLSRQNEISFVSTNDENFISNINKIQMLSEMFNIINLTNNYFNTSQFDNEMVCNSYKNILKSWRDCLPITDDNLVFWNMRLACRSILISRIQKMLKTKINDESENEESGLQNIIKNMSFIQKESELELINVALKQYNVSFAEKYLNQLKQYGSLDSRDEMLLGFQFTKTLRIKASNETNLQKKFRIAMESWKCGENIRINYAENTNLHIYVELLNNAAFMSYETFISFDLFRQQIDHSTFHESIMKIISDGRLYSECISSNDHEEMKLSLQKYCLTYLHKSVEVYKYYADFESQDSIKLLPNIYMTIAKYCRKFKQDSDDVNLTCNIITYILKSMKFSDRNARRMFPILLLELEKTSNVKAVLETFKTEIIDMPMWLLTPWISQLLAHLPKLKEVLFDVVVKLAIAYPECVVHPYRSSKKMWEMSSNFNDMDTVIKKLDKILLRDDIELLVKAIGGVCDPFVMFEMHLINIIKAIHTEDKNQRDSAFKYMFEDLFLQNSTFCGRKIRGTIFNKISGNKSSLQDAWKSCNDKENVPKIVEKLQRFVSICRQNKKPSDSKFISIGDYSPYLSTYGDNEISLLDVFGQYGKFDSSCLDHEHRVKISKFDSEVFVIGSLRRPIRINIIGSNGLKYTFMVKRGEDLRQDERIQQFFELMNDSLHSFDMKINSYKVIPLSWDLGLIQWLHNCITLREAVSLKSENQKKLISVKNKKIDYIDKMSGETTAIQYGNLALDIKASEQFHLQIVESISPYYLRDALLTLSKSPEGFMYMRKNFERSLAPMSIAHWILGIGDRHMSNCLLSIQTGSIIGIDFECAFGIATQMLSIPELIPFRLTPQLVGVLAPHGIKGKLRELMIRSLNNFQESSELLLATMEVFVHEPSMNWIKSEHNKKLTSNTSALPKKLNEWSPRDKLDQCRRKLYGVVPALITLEDLRMRIENTQFIEAYCSIVIASLNKLKIGSLNTNVVLRTNQQVDCLIHQATNNAILSVLYCGLESWL